MGELFRRFLFTDGARGLQTYAGLGLGQLMMNDGLGQGWRDPCLQEKEVLNYFADKQRESQVVIHKCERGQYRASEAPHLGNPFDEAKSGLIIYGDFVV